jgi:hypothetical protein
MKKLLILSAMCMAMTAQATVLRVSNVTNSGAPYTTIPAAIDAAVNGDTIMVDGSPVAYNEQTGTTGSLNINVRVVLMGPGYLLTQNGVQSNGDLTAEISRNIKISEGAAGTIIQGVNLSGTEIDIQVPNVVITRCKVDGSLYIATGATNCVLHQNLFTGLVGRSSYTTYTAYNAQITNNIFMHVNNNSSGILRGFNESTIAYNTFTKKKSDGGSSAVQLYLMSGCTIEHNVFFGPEQTLDNNTMADNYWGGNESPYQDCTTDLEVRDANTGGIGNELMGRGAFNGDDPYVISGIPAGPVIQDITVPATVEQGGTLNVTVKLGIQR